MSDPHPVCVLMMCIEPRLDLLTFIKAERSVNVVFLSDCFIDAGKTDDPRKADTTFKKISRKSQWSKLLIT